MAAFPELPSPANPDDALAAVVALRRLAASLEREAVDHALEQGWSWRRIGEALGMSAQAAHKRLAPGKRRFPDLEA
ncbi:helix-turn-helix domain-containing protein [Agromyces albus]|uniref:Helix-turn-helix domain-containing protein n=1 Tax=Agromyces albus TaxID=205332 RepID=A0A4Q2L5R7_9MICO|nr:helix-turn-helix domain-containing protein [Agromyces albus]RXZ73039.1 helix-turn-helix domain-containing protein [Agromyces albus]